MALSLLDFDGAPKGDLIYCSCAKTKVAGQGKSYYELIADPGTTPKVVVVVNKGNHFGYPELQKEFEIEGKTVKELQKELKARKIYKLDGYSLDEAITGGTIYRMYMEYSSGKKVNIQWYGHGVSPEVQKAYHFLESFFSRWEINPEDPACNPPEEEDGEEEVLP